MTKGGASWEIACCIQAFIKKKKKKEQSFFTKCKGAVLWNDFYFARLN